MIYHQKKAGTELTFELKKEGLDFTLKDETIQEITNTSKELQLLSTNILNWIKYQNENRRLAKEEFNMHDMVKQIFSILNSMAHQKKLNLVNQVNPEINVTQYFEPLKILIYNLITNAIHFSEKGNKHKQHPPMQTNLQKRQKFRSEK